MERTGSVEPREVVSQDDGLAPFKYIFNIFFLLKEDQRCYVKPPLHHHPRRNRTYRENSGYCKERFNHQKCIKMEQATVDGSESPSVTIFKRGWMTTGQGFIEVTQHSQLETRIS